MKHPFWVPEINYKKISGQIGCKIYKTLDHYQLTAVISIANNKILLPTVDTDAVDIIGLLHLV